MIPIAERQLRGDHKQKHYTSILEEKEEKINGKSNN